MTARIRRVVFGLLCDAAAAVSITCHEIGFAAQRAERRMARRRKAARCG